MKKDYLVITRFDYLKTPLYRWDLRNGEGGTFSNSGQYRSLKALGRAFRAQYPDVCLDMPVLVKTVYGVDKNDQPVSTSYDSYFAKMFGVRY